jgi:osmoprotectant transport system substrate-binding protein
MKHFLILLALGLVTMVGAIACNSNTNNNAIRIGSKDFTEQLILGELYAQVLEDRGYTVERKLNLGGTPVAHQSLKQGEIDLYPEYTGTALLTVLKRPSNTDPQTVYDTVAQAYRSEFNLTWLQPSAMNNTQAVVTTQEKAQQANLETLEDLAQQANQLVMIGPPEFQAREDGLPGLKQAYGDFQLQDYKAVDPGLRYTGLINQEADVAVGFTTDGEIRALDLVILADPQNVFPPAQVAPVIRQEVLIANPDIAESLNTVTTQITNETMQRLNYQVSGKNREPAEVAQEFLQETGLLTQSRETSVR